MSQPGSRTSRRRGWLWAFAVASVCVAPTLTYAGAGWYLLLPSSTKAVERIPLRQWEQRGAYPTVEACEKARHAQLAKAQGIADTLIQGAKQDRGKPPPRVTPAVRELLRRLWYGTADERDRAEAGLQRMLSRRDLAPEDADSLAGVVAWIAIESGQVERSASEIQQ